MGLVEANPPPRRGYGIWTGSCYQGRAGCSVTKRSRSYPHKFHKFNVARPLPPCCERQRGAAPVPARSWSNYARNRPPLPLNLTKSPRQSMMRVHGWTYADETGGAYTPSAFPPGTPVRTGRWDPPIPRNPGPSSRYRSLLHGREQFFCLFIEQLLQIHGD